MRLYFLESNREMYMYWFKSFQLTPFIRFWNCSTNSLFFIWWCDEMYVNIWVFEFSELNWCYTNFDLSRFCVVCERQCQGCRCSVLGLGSGGEGGQRIASRGRGRGRGQERGQRARARARAKGEGRREFVGSPVCFLSLGAPPFSRRNVFQKVRSDSHVKFILTALPYSRWKSPTPLRPWTLTTVDATDIFVLCFLPLQSSTPTL